MTPEHPETSAQLDDCYWAVVDPARAGIAIRPSRIGRQTRRKLGFLAEAQLPIPIENLHAAFSPGEDGRLIVCFADRTTVADRRARGLQSLKPSTVPDGLDAAPECFELLTGEFEPVARVRRRATRSLVAAATVTLVSGLVAIGLLRRADALESAASALDAETVRLATGALDGIGNPRLPIEARLTQHLRRLDGTRSTAAAGQGEEADVDAASLMASLLSDWPDSIQAQTDRIAVGPRVDIAASFEHDEDAEVLLAAYRESSTWAIADHTLDRQRTRSGERTRLRVSLERHSNAGSTDR